MGWDVWVTGQTWTEVYLAVHWDEVIVILWRPGSNSKFIPVKTGIPGYAWICMVPTSLGMGRTYFPSCKPVDLHAFIIIHNHWYVHLRVESDWVPFSHEHFGEITTWSSLGQDRENRATAKKPGNRKSSISQGFPGVPRGSTVHVEAGDVSRSAAPKKKPRLRFAAEKTVWVARGSPCGFSELPRTNRSEGIGKMMVETCWDPLGEKNVTWISDAAMKNPSFIDDFPRFSQ